MAQTGRAHAASIASIVHDRTTGSRIAARCCPATLPHLQPRPLPFARCGPKPSASYVVVVVLFSSCKWMMSYHYDYRIIQPGNGCRQRQGLHPLRQPGLGWMLSAPGHYRAELAILGMVFPIPGVPAPASGDYRPAPRHCLCHRTEPGSQGPASPVGAPAAINAILGRVSAPAADAAVDRGAAGFHHSAAVGSASRRASRRCR